jgi:hypothetical protein
VKLETGIKLGYAIFLLENEFKHKKNFIFKDFNVQYKLTYDISTETQHFLRLQTQFRFLRL